MRAEDFTSQRAGRVITVQGGRDGYVAFFPNPLPPNPPVSLDAGLSDLLDRANHALGKLDGVTLALPDPDFLLFTFIRKEAVLSSQIEGTQSSLSELLLFESETTGASDDDVTQTSNYLAAMEFGLDSIRGDGPPISSRLIKEMHRVLIAGTRGQDKQPGEFRQSQNWIGGTRPGDALYVPPPHHEVPQAIADLEKFIHDAGGDSRTLVKAALAHAQFESIHPFLDGNGRIGRLLITLILCDAGILERPMLYLSLYMKENRTRYYELLQSVRTEGKFEEWLQFFLEGVVQVSESVISATREIISLIESDRARIQESGRGAASALRVFDRASRRLVVQGPRLARTLNLSDPAVNNAIKRLEEMGILMEITGRARNRAYAYGEYMNIISRGLETPGDRGAREL